MRILSSEREVSFRNAHSLLLRNCRVYDPVDGLLPLANVWIQDGIIRSTNAEWPPPSPPDLVRDMAGAFVMPGLWDAHCHPGLSDDPYASPSIDREDRLERLLAALRSGARHGITAVRIVGEPLGIDLDAKRASVSDTSLPRVFAAGPALKAPKGHGHQPQWPRPAGPSDLVDPFGSIEVTDTEQISKSVEWAVGHGADWIKLFLTSGVSGDDDRSSLVQLSPEVIGFVCELAHERSVRVAAHVNNPVAAKLAIDAGVASIEHGYSLDEDIAESMADNGVNLVPTLGITHNDRAMRRMGWDEPMRRRAYSMRASHGQALTIAHRAGVSIVSGSDMRPLSLAGPQEVELLASTDLGAEGALRAATINAADMCGVGDRLGRVSPGYIADLVLLDESPLVDVSTITRPLSVMRSAARL